MLEGLEISEIKFSILKKIQTHRIDAEYYQKRNIEIELFIHKKKIKFSTLNDYNLKVDGSAFYPSIEHFYGQGYLPFLRVGDVYGKINYDSCVCIPLSLTNRYKTLKIVEKGDLVLTKGGSVARIGMVREKAAVSRDLIFINSSLLSAVESNYLYLYFQTKFANRLLIQSSSQSVQPHLTITLVREIPIFNVHIEIKKILLEMVNKSYQHEIQSKALYQQAEDILLEELGLTNFIPTQQAVNIKSIKESFEATGRFDAEYYQPKYEEMINHIKQTHHKSLKELVGITKSIEPGSDVYDEQGIPFIRVADYNKMGITEPTIKLKKSYYQNNKKLLDNLMLKKGTILLSKDGSIGIAYLMTENQDYITSGAILHLNIINDNISPEYLVLVLNSKIVQQQAERDAGGSIINHWRISQIQETLIPVLPSEKQQEISALIQESFALKSQSEHLLTIAKQAVEMAIEFDEETAMQFIKENTNNIDLIN